MGNWGEPSSLLYHFLVHTLEQRVQETIRKRNLIKPGDRVAVAVSGGADSVALLHSLQGLSSELGIVLSVAHVNHHLRGAESDEDECFVAELARRYQLELLERDAPIKQSKGCGIEAAARKQRYEFFLELVRSGRASKIATAHTLDDQAETVLMRIFRGTGTRGLAGILPRFQFEEEGRCWGEVVRPLLGFRREEIRKFLRERGLPWREDSSNRDPIFLRNKLRHKVLPVLRETFGDSAFGNLADLAEIARAEEEVLAERVASVTKNITAVDVPWLLSLPLALQRRAVRHWIEKSAPEVSLSFGLIEDILELSRGPAGRKLELRPGRVLRIAHGELRWEGRGEAGGYEYVIRIPDVVEIRQLGIRIAAEVRDWDSVPESSHRQVLDPAKVQGEFRVRNWRAGDRFWPGNTREPKKVKELLSDRHAIGPEKKLWPVAEAAGQLVWMRGFDSPQGLRPEAGATRVLWIHEL